MTQPGVFPPLLYDAYRSTLARAPSQPLVELVPTLSELTGPGPALSSIVAADADLTTNAGTGAAALGERTIVVGQIRTADQTPVPGTLVEVWQPNAAGRYTHRNDQHHAPIDPNFLGIGRCLTDADGRYRFTTIRPGAYPWGNHANAWRPAHVHFSVFGPSVATRLVTQMYFPGDPLQPHDPILNAVPTAAARERLVAVYDHDVTEPNYALGYRFDIVLDGAWATPFEPFGTDDSGRTEASA